MRGALEQGTHFQGVKFALGNQVKAVASSQNLGDVPLET